MKTQNKKLANAKRTFTKEAKEKMNVEFSKYTHKDGYLIGGVEIETTNPQETQIEPVQGEGSILSEKKRSAKWY